MSYKASMAGAFAAVATFAGISPALSHTIVGNRVFPATLTIDDPGVNDELSLPGFAYSNNPDYSQNYEFNFYYAKTITADFQISISNTLIHQINPGLTGWGGLETEAKYQVYTNAEHEFIISAAVAEDWGGVGGNQSVGANQYTAITPKIFMGKGFGDLPVEWMRPFAITAEMDYSLSTHPISVTGVDSYGNVQFNQTPTILTYGATLQYSLLYMNSFVHELPDFFDKLIPTVEVQFSTPVSNIGPSVIGAVPGTHQTTGIVAPGGFYIDRIGPVTFELGLEAVIPVNAASGRHVGALAILDFFLDDMFPNSIGKPIFGPPQPRAPGTYSGL